MKTCKRCCLSFMLTAVFFSTALVAPSAAKTKTVYPTAIFPFAERGSSVKGLGDAAADIIFTELVTRPEILLVERAELSTVLDEAALNLSGIVSPSQAVQVGALTGAKILLTGSVFELEGTLYLVAKIIGTETSRVLGESVAGKPDSLAALAKELAGSVADVIAREGARLVAEVKTVEDSIAELNRRLESAPRPVLLIEVAEQHIGQPTVDPAAETELTFIARETGFPLVDSDGGSERDADILIKGEGMSEFAMRKGDLVSVKARLEVKATNRTTGRVVAVERQTVVTVDITEQIAAKSALQEAAAAVAERLLPRLTGKE